MRTHPTFPPLLLAAIAISCGDDDTPTTMDMGTAPVDMGSDSEDMGPVPETVVYAVTTRVPSMEGLTPFMWLGDEIPKGQLSLEDSIEFSGGIQTDGKFVYETRADGRVEKFRIEGLNVVSDGVISFAARGGGTEHFFISETRAYTINQSAQEFIEWDPSTMRITGSIDLAGAEHPTYGIPFDIRRGLQRQGTNEVLSIVSYADGPDPATDVVNDLFLLLTDLDTGEVTILHEPRCPSAQGVGNSGLYTANGDFYAWSSSRFMSTRFRPDAKPNCAARIKAGAKAFDPDYLFQPSTQLGPEVVGMVEIGPGLGYTSFVDITGITNPVEFNAALLTGGGVLGYILDFEAQTVTLVDRPPGGFGGFGGSVIGNTAFVTLNEGRIDPETMQLEIQGSILEIDNRTFATRDGFVIDGQVGGVFELRP